MAIAVLSKTTEKSERPRERVREVLGVSNQVKVQLLYVKAWERVQSLVLARILKAQSWKALLKNAIALCEP